MPAFVMTAYFFYRSVSHDRLENAFSQPSKRINVFFWATVALYIVVVLMSLFFIWIGGCWMNMGCHCCLGRCHACQTKPNYMIELGKLEQMLKSALVADGDGRMSPLDLRVDVAPGQKLPVANNDSAHPIRYELFVQGVAV